MDDITSANKSTDLHSLGAPPTLGANRRHQEILPGQSAVALEIPGARCHRDAKEGIPGLLFIRARTQDRERLAFVADR